MSIWESYKFIHNINMIYILLAVFIGTIILEIYAKKKLVPGQISEEPLTVTEKILVFVFCIFNPYLAGAILYYGWRNRLPNKAKTANRISWIALGLIIASVVIGAMLGLGN
jgi:hypothetical protein